MSDIYRLREPSGMALSILARPRSGDWLEDEIADWQRNSLNTVVSLLESSEVQELDLAREQVLCEHHGIEFLSFPLPDRGVPASWAAAAAVVPLVVKLRAGRSVGVHCRAGIGRSGLVAACILVRAGIPFPQVFPILSRARGVRVPDTEAQEEWVHAFAKAGI